MTRAVANVSVQVDSFQGWINKTNILLDALSTYVITVNQVQANGDVATGNGFVNGTFGATQLVANSFIRGGNVQTFSSLQVGFANSTVTSNVDIRGHQVTCGNTTLPSNTVVHSQNLHYTVQQLTVTGNTTWAANIFYNVDKFTISGNTFTINSNATTFANVVNMNATLNVNAAINHYGGTLTSNAAVVIRNTLTQSNGAVTFGGAVQVNAAETVNGAFTQNNGAFAIGSNGTFTSHAPETLNGILTVNNNTAITANGSFILKANNTQNTIVSFGNSTHSNTAITGNTFVVNTANAQINALLFVAANSSFIANLQLFQSNTTANAISITGNTTATAVVVGQSGAANVNITLVGNTVTFTGAVSQGTGTVTLAGNTTMSGTFANVTGTLGVVGASLFNGAVTVNNSLTVNGAVNHGGGTFSSNSAHIIRNTITQSNGAVTLGGAVQVDNTLTTNGGFTQNNGAFVVGSNGTVTIHAGSTFNGTIQVNNTETVNGAFTQNNGTFTIGANTTVGINSNTTITANSQLYKSNSTITAIGIAGNSTVTLTTLGGTSVNVTSSNTTINGTEFRSIANVVLTGALQTIGGNSSFDSGVLFVDSVQNRVGINNTAPDASLTVIGTANVSANVIVGTGGTLRADGPFVANGVSTFRGAVTSNAAVTVANTLSVEGLSTFMSHLIVESSANNDIGLTGADRMFYRFPKTTYRSAKLVITMFTADGANVQTAECVVNHDLGANAYITTYAVVSSPPAANLGVITATINNANVEIKLTQTANNTKVKTIAFLTANN